MTLGEQLTVHTMTDIDPLAALSFTADGYLRLVSCVRITLYLDEISAAEFIEYCDAALTVLRPKLASYQTEPALGDTTTGNLPAAYCHVGHTLREVRLPTITGAGRGLSDELAQRWLTAFDEERP